MSLPDDLAHALDQHAARLGPFGARLVHLPEVGSTNDVASGLAQAGAEEGTIVVADSQTAGRGRRGHSWFSPPGAGLYVSLVLRPGLVHAPDGTITPGRLTLTAGVALAESLRAATALPVNLKWPNDLVVHRSSRGAERGWRKLGGILTEALATGSTLQHVIVGFGINLRSAAYPPDLADRATSIEAELGRAADRAYILVEALASLAVCYRELGEARFDGILARWLSLSPSASGALVALAPDAGAERGVTAGVDADGALLVRVGDRTQRIVAGEVDWVF